MTTVELFAHFSLELAIEEIYYLVLFVKTHGSVLVLSEFAFCLLLSYALILDICMLFFCLALLDFNILSLEFFLSSPFLVRFSLVYELRCVAWMMECCNESGISGTLTAMSPRYGILAFKTV